MTEPRRPRIDPAAMAAAAELEAGPYGGRFDYATGHAVLVRDCVDQVVALCADTPFVIEIWEKLSATNFRAVALDESMNERLREITARATDRAEELCLRCGRPLEDLNTPRRMAHHGATLTAGDEVRLAARNAATVGSIRWRHAKAAGPTGTLSQSRCLSDRWLPPCCIRSPWRLAIVCTSLFREASD